MQSSEQAGELVSMMELKALARKLFPSGSDARHLILSEPDYLPRALALAKMEIFARLLHAELGRPSR